MSRCGLSSCGGSVASSGTSRNRLDPSALHESSARSGGSAGPFFMHDVDISRNHGHGTVPVPGRESHTADLTEFDRYVSIMEAADRLEQELRWDVDNIDDGESVGGSMDRLDSPPLANSAMAAAAGACPRPPPKGEDGVPNSIDMNEMKDQLGDLELSNNELTQKERGGIGNNLGLEDSGPAMFNEKSLGGAPQDPMKPQNLYPFNAKFWAYIRSILSNAKPVGFGELPDPNATVTKGPDEASSFLSKVIAIGPLNPIQPAVIAKKGDSTKTKCLLFYGTLVGLVAMRFAPECIQCGSAVMDTDMLGRVPSRALCGGCNKPNEIDSLDKIKVMFLLNSDVLYILAENYACTPSAESMAATSVFAAVPSNSTGSGYSYMIGTGKDTEIAPALEPGKYRMHCPVAKTDNYLVVSRKAEDKDEAIALNMKVSDLVYSHRNGKKKAELQVKHGKIRFDIFPDTRSFFVLWVQKDVDDKTLMYLPEEERSIFSSAAKVIHHPIFNALFQHNQVVSVQKDLFLSIANVVLVFTDIVDSTTLYASLGDGHAFQLVRKHFQVLFGAFTRNGGRVVKTVGDAVMASFTTGRAALTAVQEAMELLPTIGRRPDNQNYLEIRVGIHCGQATVVPLNGTNDFFGQTVNIAARVQHAAKASECFVTEKVLDSSPEARQAYKEITSGGTAFKATPLTELKLKGVSGKVHARGFRWALRSRRESDMSSSNSTNYLVRKVDRSYSLRNSLRSSAASIDSNSMDDVNEETSDTTNTLSKQFERPGELGRRGSNLDALEES